MARTQKNKATSGHLGLLKVRPTSVNSHHTSFCSWLEALNLIATAACKSQGNVRVQAKLAKLRRELIEPSSGSGGGGKGEGDTSHDFLPSDQNERGSPDSHMTNLLLAVQGLM